MSQFTFLRTEFSSVYEHACKAETSVLSDPRGACFHARLALETAVNWLYRYDSSLRTPYQATLSTLIHEPTFRELVGNALVTKAKIIKDLGNSAVHDTKPISAQLATTSVRELFHFSYWLVRTYAGGEKPSAKIRFDAGKLEETVTIAASTVQQIKKLREDADANKKAYIAADRAKLEVESKHLQKEIAKAKKSNEVAPDTHNYNEKQTRDAFIDLLLHEAGWALDQEQDRGMKSTVTPTLCLNWSVAFQQMFMI